MVYFISLLGRETYLHFNVKRKNYNLFPLPPLTFKDKGNKEKENFFLGKLTDILKEEYTKIIRGIP
jgi:hypothetical protein